MASHRGDTTTPRDPDPATTSDALSMAAPPTAPLPPSAGSRVAAVAELLEMILSNLLPHDEENYTLTVADYFPHLNTILSSQFTSRTFYRTIQSSPKIRDALLLAKVRKHLEEPFRRLREEMRSDVRSIIRDVTDRLIARLG